MSTVVPAYVGAVHAVIERIRALLPRRDLELEVRLRFSDRKTVSLFVIARSGGKEACYTVSEGAYMALRTDVVERGVDKAVARILEELFPEDVSVTNGFRGVRYWTWGEKRLQEGPHGK